MSTTKSKLVGERITLDFHYEDELDPLEVISSHDIQVEVFIGEDDDPDNIIYGGGDHTAGTYVTQQFRLGIPGVIYRITCTVQTDAGRELARQRRLAILPSPTLVPPLFGDYYTTHPYPVEDSAYISHDIGTFSGRLRPMPFPVDSMTPSIILGSGNLAAALKSFTAPTESMKHSMLPQSGTLAVKLKSYVVPPDSTQHSLQLLNGTIAVKLITYVHPPDMMQHSFSLLSGTLS